MTIDSNVMLECRDGSIRRSAEGTFALDWDGGEVGTYGTLGEALRDLTEVCGFYSGPVTYGLPREDVWTAAEDARISEILPYSPAGWVRYDDVWMPGAFLPNYDGPADSFTQVDGFGDMGCSAFVVRWENVSLIMWSGPEGEGQGFEVEFDQTIEEALARAEAMALEIQSEWNLLYDKYLGLGNLAESDRFPLPDDAEELGEVYSYLREWGDLAATVGVYYWAEGVAPFLVSTGNQVVGQYESLEDLRDSIDPGDAFEAEVEVSEPDED